LNPAAIYLDDKVHILYRAQGETGISTLGYASSKEGFHIETRLDQPVYSPRIEAEKDGCEDPRITKLGQKLYLFYTAFNDGKTHIAMSSINENDFLKNNWNWSEPIIISPKEINDKNACLLSEKSTQIHLLSPH